MTVYIIAEMTIHNREEYDKYDAKFMDVFKQFDGRMLSVDEEPIQLEGKFEATRSILIEFPSSDSARAWMMSPEYQEIAKHRLAGSKGRSIMVKQFGD